MIITEAKIKNTRYRKVNQKEGFLPIGFNLSPFYPKVVASWRHLVLLIMEKKRIEVFDTKKENNLIIHFTDKLPKI